MSNPEDTRVTSQISLLSDISNTRPTSVSTITKKSTTTRKPAISVKNCTELSTDPATTMENDQSQAGISSFDELKTVLSPIVFSKICEFIHHEKDSDTVDELAEEVLEKMDTEMYPDETVKIKVDGQSQYAQIISCEKRGGASFYYVKQGGVKLPEKVNGNLIRRLHALTLSEVRIIIQNVASKQPGKPWQVHEAIKTELNIKDKFASIFCTTPKSKKTVLTLTGRSGNIDSSSEDDVPLETIRRSGAGLPPNATKKAVEKKHKEVVRKEKKEAKKEKEIKPKKEKAMNTLEAGGINKFITTTTGSPGVGPPDSSPFLTPQKRSEKRFQSSIQKLNDAWKKRDQPEFQTAATWAAKVLSGVQVDKIENPLHRFAVKKVQDKSKDADTMKKMPTGQARKEFRIQMAANRKDLYKSMDYKMKAYFNEKIIVEDLSIDSSLLPCVGTSLNLPDDRSHLISDCFMITQFISSLEKFLQSDVKITAVNLLDGLFGGRVGYMKYTAKVLCAIMRTLLHDEDSKKLSHFNARIHEFTVEENTVSEICRAFLIGSSDTRDRDTTEKKAVDSSVAKEPNADEPCDANESDDDDEGNGRFSPDLDSTQIEMEERVHMLSKLSSDVEVWQMKPIDQVELIRMLIFQILDLVSFKDYIGQDGLSEDAKAMNERITKHTEQLNKWRDTLAEIPELDDIDETLLSRTQTRERGEHLRKRQALENKIEDHQDKLEELLEKRSVEKRVQSLSKRVLPVGRDRHFRNYFLFPVDSLDAGLWIQSLGKTSYEKFICDCIEMGKTADEINSEDGADNNGWPVLQPESITESWSRITDADELTRLKDLLNNSGSRESVLKAFITKHFDEIVTCIELGNKDRNNRSVSVGSENTEHDSEESEDPLDSLKTSITQLAMDLKESYLTSVNISSFEATVVSSTTLAELKSSLIELVESIPASAIIRNLQYKDAKSSGSYSWMLVDRWKARMGEVRNASAVHVLRSYLDSRIDWKKSVVEKRCSTCGSRRSPEGKISCVNCGVVVHYYCTRPKLKERPDTWCCSNCTQSLEKANKKMDIAKRPLPPHRSRREVQSYAEVDDNESDDEEDEDDQADDGDTATADNSDDEDDDDFFSAKNKTRARSSRKRIIEESDVDDGVDSAEEEFTTRSRAKKQKRNPVLEECTAVLDKIKAENRLYRCLQLVPTRGSRRCPALNMEMLEENVSEYSSFEKFASDLNNFLNTARTYFEEHNERKLQDLEDLMISLDLASK